MPKKFIKWGALVFLVYFIATKPTEAGNLGRKIVSGAVDGLNSIGTFLATVVG